MRTVAREADLSTGRVALFVGIPTALLVIAVLLIASRASNRATRLAAREAAAGSIHPTEPEPEVLPPPGPRRRPAGPTGPSRAEGGFPIPPMDLAVPPSPRLRRRDVVAPDGAVVGTGRRSGAGTQEDPDV
jgi:NADH-quinone oxidoreductase subunit H